MRGESRLKYLCCSFACLRPFRPNSFHQLPPVPPVTSDQASFTVTSEAGRRSVDRECTNGGGGTPEPGKEREKRQQMATPSIIQPTSTPQTPRSSVSSSMKFDDNSETTSTSPGVGYVPQRKFSDAYDTASNASISLVSRVELDGSCLGTATLRMRTMRTANSRQETGQWLISSSSSIS